MMSGNTEMHEELERQLAAFESKEAALGFFVYLDTAHPRLL